MKKVMLILSVLLAMSLLYGCTSGCNHGYLSGAPSEDNTRPQTGTSAFFDA